MTAHRLTYQPSRGEPRTAPEIVCDKCLDAVHRGGAWGMHMEQVSVTAPIVCNCCHVRIEPPQPKVYCTCLSISRDPFCMHHGDVDKVRAANFGTTPSKSRWMPGAWTGD